MSTADVQVLREALCPNWGVQPHGGCEYCARNEDAHNAVTSLAARCEELEKENDWYRTRWIPRIQEERDRTEAAESLLEEAREALEWIREFSSKMEDRPMGFVHVERRARAFLAKLEAR